MPPAAVTSLQLKPFLTRCGYGTQQLAESYRFGTQTVPLAGFVGKPWDARSACIAVKDATTDSRRAAHECIELGAPTALICRGDAIDWWKLSISGPSDVRTIRASEVSAFFERHAEQLRPESIHAAKMRRAVGTSQQMWFVDVGLMPALERQAGEALNRLVTQAIRTLMEQLRPRIRSRADHEGVYKTVFWLLAAKLMRDKRVRGFAALDLVDVQQVFEVVGEHYHDAKDYPPGGSEWKPAIEATAEAIGRWGYLGNITTESLAFLYETALIDTPRKRHASGHANRASDVRKILGIHSTPSPLVDHMLSQLWPLIERIPAMERRVYEPACGHAAFLTAAMRWLREWSGIDAGSKRHAYLRQRLRGVEYDPFAVEIAKLSLTLADVPYGNTWQIEQGDMFSPGLLRSAADWATIILSNPPYEDFKKSGAKRYLRTNEPVTAQTKAVEMLKRTVPSLAPGAVFGFVLPQGTLYDREARSIRESFRDSCDIVEVSLFEDDLFSQSDHEACIVLGRRQVDGRAVSSVTYRRVRNRDMEAFKSALAFSREDHLGPSELGRGAEVSLYEPDLREIWTYLEKHPRLGESVHVQKGFEFRAVSKRGSREVTSATPRPGFVKGVLKASADYGIWELPPVTWVDLREENVRRPGAASQLDVPQVVVNYAGPRDAWRFRPVIDDEGIAVSSRFLVFRPSDACSHSLMTLWAVLLSPIANAYAYSWSGKRQTLPREWSAMPLPPVSDSQREEIEAAANAYLALVKPPADFALWSQDKRAVEHALLDLDAAVLRLYDLPDNQERQLLGLFDGVDRLGVGCRFRGYPAGWTSKQPLQDSLLPQDDRPIWERIVAMAESLPEEVFADLPSDGAFQLDHYIYGTRKRRS
jgi:hypothetical protein